MLLLVDDPVPREGVLVYDASFLYFANTGLSP